MGMSCSLGECEVRYTNNDVATHTAMTTATAATKPRSRARLRTTSRKPRNDAKSLTYAPVEISCDT